MTRSLDQERRLDAAARLAAQTELERPFVLEAGAGTGKTAALVARITAWCIGKGWEQAAAEVAARSTLRPAAGDEAVAAHVLDGVVAITFTDAAAAEMAERVGKALAEVEQGEAPVGFAPAALGGLGEEATAGRARHLLAHLDRLTVCTIHAFCRRLLAAHPLEAGIHPSFEVDAEGDRLDEVMREVVEEHLRRAYADPGDPHALALAAEGLGPAELAAAAEALVRAGVPAAELEADPFAGGAAAGLVRRVVAAAHRLTELCADRFSGVARGKVKGALAVVELARSLAAEAGGAEGGARDGLPALRDTLADPDQRTALSKLEKWRGGKLSQAEGERVGEIQEELAAAAGELLALFAHVTRLDPGLFGHARRALAPLVGAAQTRLRERGAVTYQALLTGVRELLARHPEVRGLERRRIRQLLVDEFQDTDRIQCDILRFLALDGPAEERPGLFLVGDPKQSIYGWRSADLAAYDAFVAEVLAADGRQERLSVNFRSVPVILEEVQRLVAPLMQQEEGVQPAFQPLVASPEKEGESLFTAGDRRPVEHWISWCSPEEERGGPATPVRAASELEARAVARDVRGLHHDAGVPWGEVAILLRTTSDLDLYLQALQEAGVPYAVARDKSYFRRREVMDAAALVRAVLDPADHLALVACLRSPWVGVPDAALPRLWQRGLPALATELPGHGDGPESDTGAAELTRLRTLAAEVAAELPKGIPGLARLAGWERSLTAFMEALGALRASFAADPADVFVEKLRTTTLVEATEAARYLGAWRLANLDRFFRQLAEALDEGGDTEAVLRFLRRAVAEAREAPEGRPREAAADAVQVMTVHKAKGLDFPHVYLVQLHKQPSPPPGERKTEAEEGPKGWQLLLFGCPSPGWWQVEERRRRVQAAEQVRLLYVAATRAAQRLVLAGKAEAPRPAERAHSFAQLLPHREPPPPEPEEAWARRAAAGWCEDDAHGARWGFLALRRWPRVAAVARRGGELPTLEQAERDRVELAARRAAAAGRAARPFRAPASREAHRALRQLLLARGEEGELVAAPAVPGEVATAVGSAIHALLERFDLAAEPEAELARRRDDLERFLAVAVPAGHLETARARAGGLLEGFLAGRLWRRFLALRPHVVARELAVLLPPGEVGEGPVGVVAGAVDLLYRDPADGELVVADYKTDEVVGDGNLEERARVYAAQGAIYQRAVAEALGLDTPPRFELWFLAADRLWPEPEDGQLSLF